MRYTMVNPARYLKVRRTDDFCGYLVKFIIIVNFRWILPHLAKSFVNVLWTVYDGQLQC